MGENEAAAVLKSLGGEIDVEWEGGHMIAFAEDGWSGGFCGYHFGYDTFATSNAFADRLTAALISLALDVRRNQDWDRENANAPPRAEG